MAAPCKPPRLRARTLALLAALVVAWPAWGNPGNGQTFKNWTARCEMPAGADRERCFIFQNLVLKESGERFEPALLQLFFEILDEDGEEMLELIAAIEATSTDF